MVIIWWPSKLLKANKLKLSVFPSHSTLFVVFELLLNWKRNVQTVKQIKVLHDIKMQKLNKWCKDIVMMFWNAWMYQKITAAPHTPIFYTRLYSCSWCIVNDNKLQMKWWKTINEDIWGIMVFLFFNDVTVSSWPYVHSVP